MNTANKITKSFREIICQLKRDVFGCMHLLFIYANLIKIILLCLHFAVAAELF